MRYLCVLSLLASCSSAPVPAVELPLPPEPVPVPVATAQKAGPPAAAAAAVVKRFDAARVKELDVVSAPPDTVTSSQLQKIHDEDQASRAALFRLGLQIQAKRVTAAALKAADDTVTRLHQALKEALSTGDSP
jgi:hypothetical protein